MSLSFFVVNGSRVSASVYTCMEPPPAPANETAGNGSALSTDGGYVRGANLTAINNATEVEGTSSSVPGAGRVGGPDFENDDGGTSSPPRPPPPSIEDIEEGVARSGERVTLVGSGFGMDEEAVRVMIGGRECGDPELCHRVCRPCDDEHPCDFDEMCAEDGESKDSHKVRVNGGLVLV